MSLEQPASPPRLGTPVDSVLVQLRDAWRPGWRVWRGRRSWDRDGERTGTWVASRIIDTAGVDPTVAADTAEQLDEKLKLQASMAQAIGRLVKALNERNLTATAIGSRVVQAVHPQTARRDTMMLTYSAPQDAMTWHWLREFALEPIGRVECLDRVADRITDALSGPIPRTDRRSAWRDLP